MKKSVLILLLSFSSFYFFAQTKITYNGSNNYILRERTDLRRYDNGKYTGLVNREVSSFIIPVSNKDGFLYEGSFFLSEEVVHFNQTIIPGLRNAIPSSFTISSDGTFKMIEDNGFPSFRSFPTYPQKEVTIGQTWTGKAERAVDPLNKGIVTKMPIYVEYKYIGDEYYHDEPVYLLSAQWATRYGMGTGNYYIDFGGDKDLQKATGSHKATVYVSKITGNMLVVRDSVDETFVYSDGKSIQFKGTISLFTDYPPAVDTEELIPALQRICELTDEQTQSLLADSNIQNTTNNANYINNINESFQNLTEEANNSSQISVEKTAAGIKLSIQNLQFKANSSELLPGETERLDKIAQLLLTVPDAQFLVEGHTASTGNPTGEMELSVERAKSIINELVKRKISAQKFICKGSGGTKPIADNSTSQGKALNRRVEITILN